MVSGKEKELISTEYRCGSTTVSISFTDEPMIGSTEQIRSMLLSSYLDQQNQHTENLSVDKALAA